MLTFLQNLFDFRQCTSLHCECLSVHTSVIMRVYPAGNIYLYMCWHPTPFCDSPTTLQGGQHAHNHCGAVLASQALPERWAKKSTKVEDLAAGNGVNNWLLDTYRSVINITHSMYVYVQSLQLKDDNWTLASGPSISPWSQQAWNSMWPSYSFL